MRLCFLMLMAIICAGCNRASGTAPTEYRNLLLRAERLYPGRVMSLEQYRPPSFARVERQLALADEWAIAEEVQVNAQVCNWRFVAAAKWGNKWRIISATSGWRTASTGEPDVVRDDVVRMSDIDSSEAVEDVRVSIRNIVAVQEGDLLLHSPWASDPVHLLVLSTGNKTGSARTMLFGTKSIRLEFDWPAQVTHLEPQQRLVKVLLGLANRLCLPGATLWSDGAAGAKVCRRLVM